MLGICEDYSGVIIDQNAANPTALPLETDFVYQTFRLPEGYQRGSSGSEDKFPSISGFQILASIAEGHALDAKFNYTIDQYFFGEGFSNLATGTVTGVHADGDQVWIDVVLDKEIPVDSSMTTDVSLLSIGIQNVEFVEKVWYTTPNPIPLDGEARSAKETALDPPSSFNFRILALSADSGTDFMGNPYRSVAIESSASNVQSGDNSNSGYWLSGPQPSRFAVVSHYSDLRPVPEKPTYGIVNKILNPSFEYDLIDGHPATWELYGESGSLFQVNNVLETPEGENYLEVATSHHGVQGVKIEKEIKVAIEKPITISFWIRTIGAGFAMKMFIGHAEVGEEETSFTVTNEWVRHSITLTPKASGEVTFRLTTEVDEPRTFYLDGVMANIGSEPAEYIDGDSKGCKWENERGRSGSIQLIEPEIEDNSVVIDSVLVDPITPGVAFNIYYTNDLTGSEEGEPTAEQWEQKLWVHVSQSYVTAKKNTYILPEPIVAKFIKIEFSYLQARSYNPGDFQIPVSYKKFPDWVSETFIAAIKTPAFVAKKVGVAYDALEFAYDYHLEDLKEKLAQPLIEESKVIVPAANQVDATTLSKINLTMNTYLHPPAEQANPTLLGEIAKNLSANQTNYPVEKPEQATAPLNIPVSGLERQAIVLDESMPVMYFFVTCRHEYKEAKATFDNNKAYFAGLNELAFIRNTYTTTSDGEEYVESGGDDTNTNINDFVIEEGNWFTYG